MTPREQIINSLYSAGRSLRAAILVNNSAGIILLAIAYLAGVYAFDRLFEFQSLTRIALGSAFVAGVLGMLVMRIVSPILRAYHVTDLALIAERTYPQFNGSLITSVEITEHDDFAAPLGELAATRLKAIPNFVLINTAKCLRIGLYMLVALAVSVTIAVSFKAESRAFFARLTGANVPYPEIPAFSLSIPENIRIAEGSSLTIGVDVINGYSFSSVLLEIADGSVSSQLMKPVEENSFELTLENITRPISVRARANGKISKKHHIEVVSRPAMRSLEIEVEPPSYSGGRRAPLMAGQGNIRVLAGSRVFVSLISTKELQVAAILFADGNKSLMTIDRALARAEFSALTDTTYTFELRDKEGFDSANLPIYRISILPDKPPIVNLDSPKANRKVAPDGAFRLKARIRDDFGITSAKLYMRLEADSTREVVIELPIRNGVKDIELNQVIELAPLSLQAGESFTMFIEVRDNRPDPNIVATSAVTLRAVRPYELLEDLQLFLAAAKERIGAGIELENALINALRSRGDLRTSLVSHRLLLRDLQSLAPDFEQAADDFRLNRLGDEEANLLQSVASALVAAVTGHGNSLATTLTLIASSAQQNAQDYDTALKSASRFRDALALQLSRLARFENFAEVLRELKRLIGKQEELRDRIRDIIEKRFGR